VIDSAIRTILLADATISGLVGTKIRARVAHDADALPYLVYIRGRLLPLLNYQGQSGTCSARFEIQSWSDEYSTVLTLGKAVRDALDAYSAGGTVGADTILGVVIEDEDGAYEPPVKQNDQGVFGSVVSIKAWFLE